VPDHWAFILAAVSALRAVKEAVQYGFARVLGLPRYHGLLFGMLLAHGGEFSCAIFNEAWDNHLMDLDQRDVLAVVVAVSMGVVPILINLLERVPERLRGMADLPEPDPDPATAGGRPDASPRVAPPTAADSVVDTATDTGPGRPRA
ncbi:transporter, partial [Achromobacter xylosoxidans]